ncbi:MAG: type II toxin-antitoxin system RelE/ParE family toxin [Sulfurimonas sp.]|uniref:type II toxin-antitoxin system RelE family toxin n=1 Tax=Sulfurimonas sp. TaxID=2022749 RepID=UPI00262F24C5|nr:type II toxin-antitoxin system RelE/ParE family toxin [Sulfurimonas sp.]MDD5373245.1 type II toxin-antitoxin system RelE/ParE family toxin [Sulfurimonas sp.]
MYEIKYHPLVEADLEQLNHSVRIEVFKKLKKIQISPELGQLLGNKNNMDLTGLRKVYVAKKQVRIVYEIIDNLLVVKVITIGKREDMEVYKQAQQRRKSL